MNVIKKWTLPLLVVASFLVSVIPSGVVFATSDYGVVTTNTLSWAGGSVCGTQDNLTTYWDGFLDTTGVSDISYKNSWNYTTNYYGDREVMDTFVADFNTNKEAGAGYGVIQTQNSENGAYGVRLVIFPYSTMTLHNGYLQLSSGNFRTMDIFLNTNASCRLQINNASNGGSSSQTPYLNWTENYSPQTGTAIFFIATDDITYPTDYTGDPIPDIGAPAKTDIYPTMSMAIDADNTLTLSVDPQFLIKYDFPTPDNVLLHVYDSTDTEIIPSVLVGGVGKYFRLADGDYTATLDVVYNDETLQSLYNFKQTLFKFQANHTDYQIIYSGSTGAYCSLRGGTQENCDISQPQDETHDVVTGEPSVYEDETCDITHLGGCIRNGIHWLGEYLGFNSGNGGQGNGFKSFTSDTFGVTAIIVAPLGILNALQAGTYTCTPISLPLPFVDSDLTLPCLAPIYEDYFGAFFAIYQTIINGIVSYYVIVKILSDVKDFKDPQKDKIEVLAL